MLIYFKEHKKQKEEAWRIQLKSVAIMIWGASDEG